MLPIFFGKSDIADLENLAGMGEHIHNFRLGNNFTATFYAADAGVSNMAFQTSIRVILNDYSLGSY